MKENVTTVASHGSDGQNTGRERNSHHGPYKLTIKRRCNRTDKLYVNQCWQTEQDETQVRYAEIKDKYIIHAFPGFSSDDDHHDQKIPRKTDEERCEVQNECYTWLSDASCVVGRCVVHIVNKFVRGAIKRLH